MPAASAMSVMVQSGLAGVSIQTSLVLPGRTPARMAAGSPASTKVASMPRRGRVLLQPLAQAPVHDVGRDHVCGPLQSQEAVVAAVMPEANTRLAAPPSSCGQHRLDLAHGGVVGPAVGVALAVLVVGIANEGGRHVHGPHDGAGLLVDHAARLRGNGLGRQVLHVRPSVARFASRAPALPPGRGDTPRTPRLCSKKNGWSGGCPASGGAGAGPAREATV